MRPPVPDVVSRSRKASVIEQPQQPQWIDPRSAPTTFFLSRTPGLDPDELSPNESYTSRESMYGVHSLEETANQADSVDSLCNSVPSISSDPAENSAHLPPLSSSSPSVGGEDDTSQPFLHRNSVLKPFDQLLNIERPDAPFPTSNPVSPRPLTPLNVNNPDDASSLLSSPKSISNQSMRHLDDISITDDLSSQAVASGEEDNDLHAASSVGPITTSQLIMPIIRMPSRRPFTDRGKTLGRLKVLFAGASGSGKTSLIKSIVQECEDIVHVDSFPSTPSSQISRYSNITSQPLRDHGMPTTVSEIYASTKPYPAWWSDLEDSRVLRRRRSVGDVVLERNVCFVDTPKNTLSRTGQNDAVLQYLRQQLLRATTSLQSPNHDFQNLLAGRGGAQVDAVLYLISEDTLASDIECMRKLSEWTNVVPIIAKSDILTPDQISSLRSTFHQQSHEASISPFFFGDSYPSATSEQHSRTPFAVSSAKSNNDDEMDASTLMSPDYVQPLVASDLSLLVEKLFDPENMAWIRHSAAKKLSQMQKELGSRSQTPFYNGSLTSFVPTARCPSPSYTMSQISDHTRREEKLARVHLAKWASDLQQSLQNERERYSAVARGERAVWLTERLGECVVDGSLVPITQTPGFHGLRGSMEKTLLVRPQNGQPVEYQLARISPHDPLGLVGWSEDLKQRGWAIVQIVGSFGVVGGMALWLAKTWGLSSQSLSEWGFDWHGLSD
ncbi:hypothetical protein FE257_012700 [Aspergillus nanangensis]|uniref:Septin-type G domain-containing protein n=1 Tax=Aspergillus nanangensis TaxID=2582783 RepID=A0AAD4CFN8_ASPNN|nr:hypothetical protein FE257_012700 [Aspergillus nanangensis]